MSGWVSERGSGWVGGCARESVNDWCVSERLCPCRTCAPAYHVTCSHVYRDGRAERYALNGRGQTQARTLSTTKQLTTGSLITWSWGNANLLWYTVATREEWSVMRSSWYRLFSKRLGPPELEALRLYIKYHFEIFYQIRQIHSRIRPRNTHAHSVYASHTAHLCFVSYGIYNNGAT